LHDDVQALVKRTSQHRLYLVSELFGVSRFQVGVEGRLILPDRNDCVMILARDIVEQFKAHDALVLFAIGGELLQDFGSVGDVTRSQVDVRDHVELFVLPRDNKTGCEEQKRCE